MKDKVTWCRYSRCGVQSEGGGGGSCGGGGGSGGGGGGGGDACLVVGEDARKGLSQPILSR